MSVVPESDQVSRVGYKSRVALVAPGVIPQRAGEVNPAWFHFQQLFGIRVVEAGGAWLNCQFVYRKLPLGSGEYDLSAAVHFDTFARRTGLSYVRCCSCPDAARRVASGAVGEGRKCKHMIALGVQLAAQTGGSVPVTGIPSAVFFPPSRPRRQRQSAAVRQARGWVSGEWHPADGWESEK